MNALCGQADHEVRQQKPAENEAIRLSRGNFEAALPRVGDGRRCEGEESAPPLCYIYVLSSG
jgi:hypothetical protein